MAGRASVWADEELRRVVAERAVACADETWRLQRGEDAECRMFQAMADAGHYGKGGGTRQGVYVASASGRLLTSINSLDPNAVKARVLEGLAAWEELPESERHLASEEDVAPDHRWEQSRPADGLVLVTHNRDLPDDLDPERGIASRWNRDHAWFTAQEARALLPADLVARQEHDVPSALVARLARFHIVDNVKGQTLPFAEQEVTGSELRCEVVRVDGDRVDVRFAGTTRAVSDGEWLMGENDWRPVKPWPRGVLSRVRGAATWDDAAGAYTRFEMVAQGVRWGPSQFNGRKQDPGPAPLGVAFRLAPADRASSGVAPAFIDVYDASWVRAP